jgi:hypothetical protein
MPAPTVAVTVKLFAQDGTPYADTEVRAKLDQNDVYEGFIVSDEVTGTTDATGTVVLNLFPNNPTTGLGTTGSSYIFKAQPVGGKSWRATAQIPNEACNLEDVVDTDVVLGRGAAEIAQDNAQASALAADASEAAALASQVAAAASAAAALASETAADASEAMALRTMVAGGVDPPDDPLPNAQWRNPANGKLYEYVADSDGSQWVEAGSHLYNDDPISVAAAEAARDASAASAAAALVSQGAAGVSAANAAASAVAAEVSRDAIDNRLYPGSYAEDPTLRPDGSACQAGDEYFSSSANLKKRYNGATWVASDINTANLAASGGSALVGFIQAGTGASTETVQEELRARRRPEQFAVEGDGSTNDTANLNISIIRANSAGGGGMHFDGAKTYKVQRANAGVQDGGGIIAKPNVNLYGHGARILLNDNCNIIDVASTAATSSVITADIAAGATVVTVTNGALFAAGDSVLYRAGEDSVDTAESTQWGFAKVSGVSSNDVTLDTPIPRPCTVAAVTNALNKTLYKLTDAIDGLTISDFYLDNPATGDANTEIAIYCKRVRNVTINNVKAKNPGAGVVYAQYCENVTINNPEALECDQQGGHSAKGRAFGGAECRNVVINNARMTKLESEVVACEFSADMTFNSPLVIQTRTGGTPNLFGVGSNSRLTVSDLRVVGAGAFNLFTRGGLTNNDVCFHNVELDLSSAPLSLGVMGTEITGQLRMHIAGTKELYEIGAGRWCEQTIFLEDNWSFLEVARFDPGLLGPVYVYTSSTVDATETNDIPDFYIGRASDNGSNYASQLVSGKLAKLTGGVETNGTNGGALFSYRAEELKLLVSTKATGMTGANKFITIRAFIVPKVGDFPYTMVSSNLQASRADFVKLTSEATWDPGSLADGVGETSAGITVTGAALGDFVIVSAPYDLQGIACSGYVSAADTVNIRLQNETTGVVDLGSGTWRVLVLKKLGN